MVRFVLILGLLFCFCGQAWADDYVIPSTPMDFQSIQQTIRDISKAGLIPEGDTTYEGNDPTGGKCEIQINLETPSSDSSNGTYSFYIYGSTGPFSYIRMDFGYFGPGSGGDAAPFYLLRKSIRVSNDGKDGDIEFAVLNRAGFGADRMVVYKIHKINGSISIQLGGAFANSGAFPPGPISVSFDQPCNQLKARNQNE